MEEKEGEEKKEGGRKRRRGREREANVMWVGKIENT